MHERAGTPALLRLSLRDLAQRVDVDQFAEAEYAGCHAKYDQKCGQKLHRNLALRKVERAVDADGRLLAQEVRRRRLRV